MGSQKCHSVSSTTDNLWDASKGLQVALLGLALDDSDLMLAAADSQPVQPALSSAWPCGWAAGPRDSQAPQPQASPTLQGCAESLPSDSFK
jgi:hypothetical protein